MTGAQHVAFAGLHLARRIAVQCVEPFYSDITQSLSAPLESEKPFEGSFAGKHWCVIVYADIFKILGSIVKMISQHQ